MKAHILSLGLVCCIATSGAAEDRTIKQFKQYVQSRLGDRLTAAQLNQVGDLVDANSDGKVSEAEFATRMERISDVLSGKVPSKPKKPAVESKPPPIVETPPLVRNGKATVLLITADELAEAWIPFAKWKTTNGKLTRIVTTGQINRDYTAENLQEKIRLCVRSHIEEQGTRWVILGGDSLPGGGGLVPGGHTTEHAQERKGIPTDIVYLSPTNWDADGDGIYGEFRDDRNAITYPDGTVGLGRIPVRTTEDVAAFTDTVIAYESNYPTNRFAQHMIYTCTDRPAYPKVRNSWDSYVSRVWDGNMDPFFSGETPWDKDGQPGSYPLSAENLVELLNRKETGKLHIHGHGHLPAWVLEESKFTANHIGQLKNDGAYPVTTTVSCNTGEYDSLEDPSIVERLLRVPNAGSVAVVAPVRTGKAHFASPSDFRLMLTEGKLDGTTLTMTRFWTFGLNGAESTGHAFMKAKQAMAEDGAKAAGFHLCLCELNLLGDPTLDLRAQAPKTPPLTIESESVNGKVAVSIETLPGATVCFWATDELYLVNTADESGRSIFTVPAFDGEATVTVSGASLNSVSRSFGAK